MPPHQRPHRATLRKTIPSDHGADAGLSTGARTLVHALLQDNVVVPFPQPPKPRPKRPFAFRPIVLLDAGDDDAARPPVFQRRRYVRRRALGEILVDTGALSPVALARALATQREMGLRLGDLLVRTGQVSEQKVTEALGQQHCMGLAEAPTRVDEALDQWARCLPVHIAKEYRALPWRKIGNRTLIATSRPDRIDELTPRLPDCFGDCVFAVVSDSDLDKRLGEVHGAALAREAECRVPARDSCRRLRDRGGASTLALAFLGLCALALFFPLQTLGWATVLGIFVLFCNIGLRVAALASLRQQARSGGPFSTVRTSGEAQGRLPPITLLVPLHREPEIAAALTARLSRLDYPKALLDICLVVEADDLVTRAALAKAALPPWMRVIAVPEGSPRTKPRAMNYALNFARGDIVGVYDAEDAPAPDQLRLVAARFLAAPPEVACLQGVLDYYNPNRNWMARCFTIEYANWFRMILPGIARMGLVVPLGGTTLFFRRSALEAVGAWDAHNVTEDADLGVRLARRGLRTEVINTTTLEEANACPFAWVKQRSRWMKGYILTWAVHTHHPLRLWTDLGPKRFFGFHLLFLGSILNALLLPVLWSTIVIAFGVWHPVLDWMPGGNAMPLAVFFVSMTLLNMSLTMVGCHAAHHRSLRRWVPTLEAYFPLASLAIAKAIFEIVLRPFHWDKTSHGAFGGDDSTQEIDTLHNGLVTLSGR